MDYKVLHVTVHWLEAGNFARLEINLNTYSEQNQRTTRTHKWQQQAGTLFHKKFQASQLEVQVNWSAFFSFDLQRGWV